MVQQNDEYGQPGQEASPIQEASAADGIAAHDMPPVQQQPGSAMPAGNVVSTGVEEGGGAMIDQHAPAAPEDLEPANNGGAQTAGVTAPAAAAATAATAAMAVTGTETTTTAADPWVHRGRQTPRKCRLPRSPYDRPEPDRAPKKLKKQQLTAPEVLVSLPMRALEE
jgi:hypothetical protein